MSNNYIKCQRALFDIPDNVTYLNCAYMSPLLKSAQIAAAKGLEYKARPWTYKPQDFFRFSEQYRKLAAKLIGTNADNIAIIPAASYGLQIAANALTLRPGGEILVLEDQFPSNIYPWRELAKKSGGRVVNIARAKNGNWTEAVLKSIGANTEILTLPATHWADGGLLDLAAISIAARATGAKLVLDLTQSLGAMEFDVDKIKPDFMVAAGYKWLFGPYTLGFIYIDPKWHKAEPLEHNWMNRQGSENFAALVNYKDGFQTGARRFDMGEKSNPGLLLAGINALEQILDWGVDNIARTLGARNKKIAARARELGYRLVDDNLRAPHYISLGLDADILTDLAYELTRQNIFVSVRGNSIRITAHLYNNDADIEKLFAVLSARR